MTIEEIQEEKEVLEGHVIFLNEEVNVIVNKRKNKIEEGVSRKLQISRKNNSRFKYNEWDDAGIEQQVKNNLKFIVLLREELVFLKTKLGKYQESGKKMERDQQVKELKEDLIRMKLNLIERKRKNVLADKKLSSMDNSEINKNKIYFDLQQEYVVMSKKKEEYQNRTNQLVQNNANSLTAYTKVEERYEELKLEMHQFWHGTVDQNDEHNKVMYDAKCRKMELSLRKRERDEEEFKRKYYILLKDYEKIINNIKFIDQSISKALSNIHGSNDKLSHTSLKAEKKHRKVDSQNVEQYRVWENHALTKKESEKESEYSQKEEEQKEHEEEEENEEQSEGESFMLTGLEKKSSSRATKKINYFNKFKCEFEESKSNKKSYSNCEIKEQQLKKEIRGESEKIFMNKIPFGHGKNLNEEQNEKQTQRKERVVTSEIENCCEINEEIMNSGEKKESFTLEYEDDFEIEDSL